MYIMHVLDLPVLVACGTRKGRSKEMNEHFLYHTYAVTDFTKHKYFLEIYLEYFPRYFKVTRNRVE